MFLFKIEVLKTLCVQIRTDAHRCVLRHFPHDLQFTYVILSRSLVLFGGWLKGIYTPSVKSRRLPFVMEHLRVMKWSYVRTGPSGV